MGSSKSGKRKATPAAPLKPMPAQGRGGKKRTPQSAFDPAAGKDIYEPERIVAERLAKGVTQFHVKWVNWEPKHNTWEPIENLSTPLGPPTWARSARTLFLRRVGWGGACVSR